MARHRASESGHRRGRVRRNAGPARATGLVAATVVAAGLVPAIGHADPLGGPRANNPGSPAGSPAGSPGARPGGSAIGARANGPVAGLAGTPSNANASINTDVSISTSTNADISTSSGSSPSGLDAIKQQVAALYQQAEASTEQYDATEERIARLQSAVASSGTRSAQLRARLAAATGILGRLAAEQYRDAGLTPSMALVFFTHPDSFLERAGMTDRMATVDQQRVVAVQRDQQALAALERESAGALDDLHAAELQLAAHRADIQAKLATARARLDALGAADRGTVTAALAGDDGYNGYGGYGGYGGHGGYGGYGAYGRYGGYGSGYVGAGAAPGSGSGSGSGSASGSASPGQAPPSLSSLLSAITDTAAAPPDVSRVVTAVETAYNELGKPYVWGATGPGEFDCSGLTQHVWAAAGVQLPRTSEEQAEAGQSVPVSAIRPGDLVVYYSGTHIGIYVGRGLVIHAPRPGSVVQFAPLNEMPIAKVVRPVS